MPKQNKQRAPQVKLQAAMRAIADARYALDLMNAEEEAERCKAASKMILDALDMYTKRCAAAFGSVVEKETQP